MGDKTDFLAVLAIVALFIESGLGFYLPQN